MPASLGADGSAQGGTARPSRQRTFVRDVTAPDVLLTFLAVVVAPVLVGVILAVVGAKLEQRRLLGLVIPLATAVASLGVWAALVRRGWSWSDLGYVRARRSLWHLVWETPLLWTGAVVLTAVLGTLSGIRPSGTGPSTSSSADALELGVFALLITAVCITVVVPLLEEILFRRVLFGWFEQRLGAAAAVTGSALTFGVVHIAPPVMLLQLLIGLGAAFLVRAHRTLWASLALHGLNNGIVTVITLLALLRSR